jgi:hypothetical protein
VHHEPLARVAQLVVRFEQEAKTIARHERDPGEIHDDGRRARFGDALELVVDDAATFVVEFAVQEDPSRVRSVFPRHPHDSNLVSQA